MANSNTIKRKRQNGAYKANRVVRGDQDAVVIVISRKRRVSVIVKGWSGKVEATAAINLDDEAVGRLIRRLCATRGGKASKSVYKIAKDRMEAAEALKKKADATLPERIVVGPDPWRVCKQPGNHDLCFPIGAQLPPKLKRIKP